MSGSASSIAIKIDVNDLASKQIAALEAQIAKLQAPTERASKGIRGMAKGGVGKLAGEMRDVARESGAAFYNIGRMVPALGAITGMASVAGLATLAKDFGTFAQATTNASRRIGMSTPALVDWQNAATLGHANPGAMTAGLTALQDSIAQVNAQMSPEKANRFAQFGIATKHLDGSARSATEIMPELADKLAAIKNPTERAAKATELLGGAAEGLMPMFLDGSHGIKEYLAKAHEMAGLTDKQIAQGVDLNDSFNAVTVSAKGLADTVGAALDPVLAPMLDKTSQWISGNRDLISQDVAGWAKDYGAALGTVGTGIDKVVTGTIGWNKALEIGIPLLASRMIPPIARLENVLARLAFIKIPGWLLTPQGALTAGAAAGAVATYYNGQNSATAQDEASKQGYTRVASVDSESGMPTAFTNPKTGDTKSAMQFDRRYNPSLQVQPSAPPAATPAGDQSAPNGVPQIGPTFGPQTQDAAPPGLTKNLFGKLANSQLGKLLARGESGAADYNAVNRGAAGGYAADMENLVNMTVAQVQAAQRAHKFNAAGRYQVIGPTLDSAVSALGLTGNEKFDRTTQDKIFEQYLIGSKRKEIAKYIDGESNDLKAAVLGMSKEWASVADPSTGLSHYGGVGHNKASISVQEAEDALNAARHNIAMGPPAPGIQGGSGTPPAAPSDATIKGGADLKITLSGFPTDAQTAANTTGNVFSGPPLVEHAMPMGLHP